MTILCHNLKMFPLSIAGVLRLWDGPLGCLGFYVTRLNVTRIFLEDCFGVIVGGFFWFGFCFVVVFFNSDRAASQVTAIMCQEE